MTRVGVTWRLNVAKQHIRICKYQELVPRHMFSLRFFKEMKPLFGKLIKPCSFLASLWEAKADSRDERESSHNKRYSVDT